MFNWKNEVYACLWYWFSVGSAPLKLILSIKVVNGCVAISGASGPLPLHVDKLVSWVDLLTDWRI